MREIDINDFYTSININQRTQYCHANQNTKEWERWISIPIFPIEATLWLVFLLIIVIITNLNKLLLFCESFTWLFNCSLWVQYPSLRTHYYFWQRGTLAVKSHQYVQLDFQLGWIDKITNYVKLDLKLNWIDKITNYI